LGVRGFRSFLALGAIGAALVGASAAAAEPAPSAAAQAPAAGPVRVDMSLDAARKAHPKAAWKNVPSMFTGKTIAIEAPSAWTLGGQDYLLKLTPHASGKSTLVIDARPADVDVDGCRARTLALVAHLDGYFRDIKDRRWIPPSPPPPMPAPTISVQRMPDGTPYVTAQPNFASRDNDDEEDENKPVERELTAGARARVAEVVAPTLASWDYGQPATKDYPYSLEGRSDHMPADEALSRPSRCHISAVVRSEPWGGAREETLDASVQPLPLAARDLHKSLDGVELPEAPVALAFRCDVWRASGRLGFCATVDKAQDKLPAMTAARRRLPKMAFDPAKLDPDSDLLLRANLTVTVSSAERLSDEALAALPPAILAPPKGLGPVLWAKAPTSADISSYYPTEALRKGMEARVTATCEIAADLTLACASVESDPPGLTMFEDAVRKILQKFRAEPKLRSGASAVGTKLKVPLRFQLED
jgi:TonB family protein